MSNYEDWERRNSLTPGCAVILVAMCAAWAVVLFYFVVSRLLFDYPDGSWGFITLSSALGGLFLYGAVAVAWRLAKRKPIPYVKQGGEPPPTIETYHFLPTDDEGGKNKR